MASPPCLPLDAEYPEASQATTVLILAILGVWPCFLLGPVAWWIGSNELAAIDAGRRPPEGRAKANAGRIIGIVSTLTYVAFLAVLAALLALGNR